MGLECLCSDGDEILSQEDIDSLFGKLEEVKNFSKKLVRKLNPIKQTTSGVGIAAVFLELAKELQSVYSGYAIWFPKIVEAYQTAQQNPRFIEFEKVSLIFQKYCQMFILAGM